MGFVEILKLLCCRIVSRVDIRMIFAGQLAISLFDFLLAGFAINTQNFVVVFVFHGGPVYLSWLLARGDHHLRRAQQLVAVQIAFLLHPHHGVGCCFGVMNHTDGFV